MSLSDNIRKFVITNYFKPARSRGEKTVTLVSGQIHSELRLKNRMPAVCSALRSKQLEEDGNTSLIRETRAPNVKMNSSTNQFEFKLHELESDECDQEDAQEQPDNALAISPTSQEKGTLVVIQCGKHKIWNTHSKAGPTQAKQAYISSQFKVNKEYAETFSEDWAILSAKYGFITPEFIIPGDYNVTFDDPSTNPIDIDQLRNQVENHYSTFNKIVVLGSATYANIVESAFKNTKAVVLKPTAGLNLFDAIHLVKEAVRTGKPLI